MTAADLEAPLAALAADNTHAAALIYGAQEQLSGPDLERHLLAHAQPGLFVVGYDGTVINALLLEHYVDLLRTWDRDEAEFRHVHGNQWRERDEIVAEVWRFLKPLLTGRPPCDSCLRGSLTTLDAVGSEGDCERHDVRACAA